MKLDPMVDVRQSAYSTYINSISGAEGFFEGRDVGRTHGLGCVYIGDRLVAEWSWTLGADGRRVWSYKMLRSAVLAIVKAADS